MAHTDEEHYSGFVTLTFDLRSDPKTTLSVINDRFVSAWARWDRNRKHKISLLESHQ